MDYIEDDFTDALIDAICEKSPRNWYTLVGENFDPDEETIVKESDNKKDIEDAFNESKDDFDLLYVAWCLESWQGFSLTSYERSNYMKGLERQLEKELILKVSKCKTIV